MRRLEGVGGGFDQSGRKKMFNGFTCTSQRLCARAKAFAIKQKSWREKCRQAKTKKGTRLGAFFLCMARWGGVEPPTFWFVARMTVYIYQPVRPLYGIKNASKLSRNFNELPYDLMLIEHHHVKVVTGER